MVKPCCGFFPSASCSKTACCAKRTQTMRGWIFTFSSWEVKFSSAVKVTVPKKKKKEEKNQKMNFLNILWPVYLSTLEEHARVSEISLCLITLPSIVPLQFVRWENSKRLVYGSLVCLSCDHFESLLYATVADRDPKKLTKGQVAIMFTDDSRDKLARMEVGNICCF